MDIKYCKENKSNYIVIACVERRENEYQQKILMQQKMPHILPCSVRFVNGTAYYYYEITSKISLDNYFQNRNVSYEQVKKLFFDMDQALKELANYWLEEEKVILNPEFIYYDFSKDSFQFLFYPAYETDDNMYQTLTDFLIEYADAGDRKVIECLYQINEESQGGTMHIQRILEVIQGQEITEEKVPLYQEMEDRIELVSNIQIDSGEEQKETTDSPIIPKRQMIFSIFLLIAAVGIMVGAGAVYWYLPLTENEIIVMLAIALIAAGIFVVDFVWFIQKMIRGKKSEKYHKEIKLYKEDQNYPQMSEKEYHVNDFSVYSIEYGQNRTVSEYENKKEETVTEYFEQMKGITDYTLFSTDRKNFQHIPLNRLPCTIGKMQGMADFLIEQKGISKLHAKIETEDDKLLLQDLNSTNGTFLNGLRLTPNEKVEIMEGDEIRFGIVSYVLR